MWGRQVLRYGQSERDLDNKQGRLSLTFVVVQSQICILLLQEQVTVTAIFIDFPLGQSGIVVCSFVCLCAIVKMQWLVTVVWQKCRMAFSRCRSSFSSDWIGSQCQEPILISFCLPSYTSSTPWYSLLHSDPTFFLKPSNLSIRQALAFITSRATPADILP